MKTKTFILMAIFIGISVGIYAVDTYKKPQDTSLTNLLNSQFAKGVTADYLNEVGVKSFEDVKFSQTERTITVHFGKYVFDVQKDNLTDKMLGNLNNIGIKVLQKPDGTVILKYKDNFVKEIVK